MGTHNQLEYATATGNDYAAHEGMYRRFCTLTAGSVAVVAVIVIMMATFLV